MDFNALLERSLPTSAANLTATGAGTATIVASLGPLLGAHFEPVLRFLDVLGELLRLNPIILPILGLLWAGRRLGPKCWRMLIARSIFSITCSSDSDTYLHIKRYISQYGNANSRSFTVETDIDDKLLVAPKPGGHFNYKQKARNAYKLTPSYGEHGVWYGHRYIWIERNRRVVQAGRDTHEEEEFTISTISLSIKPLEAFIQFVQENYERSTDDATVIRCLADRRFPNPWSFCKKVPIRPLDTVILGKQKEEIMNDMDAFLKSEDWYRERAIPYRRGYLLHGPPGTGKSSLCAALAGFFGLDIYFIPGKAAVDDEDLIRGFRVLPSRCVVLFEDIDAMSFKRDSETSFPKRDGFSLSGLLNVLDGVAAPEGRVRTFGAFPFVVRSLTIKRGTLECKVTLLVTSSANGCRRMSSPWRYNCTKW